MRRLLLLVLLACLTAIAQDPPEAGHPAEAAEHKGGGIEADPVWKWANFVLLALGLGYLMGKSLPPAFRARTQEIQKDIAVAQQTKRDADQRAAQMEARLKSLAAEIEAFRTEAASDMRREGERISDETARQIKRLEAQAEVEIESAGKSARRELKQYAADLALKLAEERIRSRMDGASEAALVDHFAAELGRQGSKN
jgi:F-type H+-transporting ATPase subunit b